MTNGMNQLHLDGKIQRFADLHWLWVDVPVEMPYESTCLLLGTSEICGDNIISRTSLHESINSCQTTTEIRWNWNPKWFWQMCHFISLYLQFSQHSKCKNRISKTKIPFFTRHPLMPSSCNWRKEKNKNDHSLLLHMIICDFKYISLYFLVRQRVHCRSNK